MDSTEGAVTPRVAIVVPTYDRLNLLKKTVRSVLSQTYQAFELIVIDDGSTDGTNAFLESLGDERVRTIVLEHSGNPAKLRNVGVAASTAEWIAFLDSDDTWTPTKLDHQLRQLRAQPEYQWSFTDFDRIDDADNEFIALRRLPVKSGFILSDLIDGTTGIALPTVMMRRSLFEECGRFDESFVTCEDYELWVRLASKWPVLGIPERLASIRAHPGNTRPWRTEVFENLLRVYRSVMNNGGDKALAKKAAKRYAWCLTQLSGLRRVRGEFGVAFRLAVSALITDILSPGSWIGVAKAIIHPFIPRERARIAG